jgi:capsular exopolysaccharide synthesis family protein
MQETDKFQKKLPNQEIDYFKIGKILISRWYWIAATTIIAMAFAKVYLWVTPKMYSTGASMKFEDKKAEFTDITGNIGSYNNTWAKIQSELSVIQSNQLALRAIKDIDYKISFYISGRVRVAELYPQKPLDIQFITLDSLNIFHNQLTYKPIDRYSYSLSYKEGKKTIQQNYRYNNPVTMGPTSFMIKYPGYLDPNTTYLFNFNLPQDLLGRARGGLHTGEVSKSSNILPLQQTDANPYFAADILNAIMREYLLYDREQKTKSASQIINFVNQQLNTLSGKLKQSESSLEQYKQNRKIISMASAVDNVIAKAKDIETKRSGYKLQLLAIDEFKDKLIHGINNAHVNFDLSGTLDPLLTGLIATYNNLLNEKIALQKIHNNNASQIKDIDQQILQIKSAVLANIDSQRDAIVKTMNYLDEESKTVNQQINVLPTDERALVTLQRDFEIDDKVFSFLSEKKIDAQISSSAILPGASIVDLAQPNLSPIAPSEHEINRTAIIIGLLSGLGIIILIRILNPYIYDKETVESLTTVPIIGVIRKFPASLDEDNSQLLALSKPRSIFAESVRSVRTNLNFLASDKAHKVICITSEVAGEGKSFVAVNLSSTLALINKKVILIGADLRRSRIHKTFRVPNDRGLSNYLANQAETADLIHRSEVENLDFIISGPVPPNPSELLHSQRMQKLIDELKLTYDIIVIDTAPIGLVSDSIPLIRISDINVFVIRSGKSKYYAATVPQRIASEYHLDNTVIILNAFEEDLLHSRYYTTKFTGEGYGSRYYYYSDYAGYTSSGYYVDDEDKKWWDIRRWIKF